MNQNAKLEKQTEKSAKEPQLNKTSIISKQ